MPRGKTSKVGDVTVNANGYSQTKTADGKWVGTHVLILEEKLGRKLVSGERAIFKDGSKRNLDPSNIELAVTHSARTLRAKIARWKVEIEDRQEWIRLAEKELEQPTNPSTSSSRTD